nr:polyprotein [atypical porcine pestivirus]
MKKQITYYLKKEKQRNGWTELVVGESHMKITTLSGRTYRGTWEMEKWSNPYGTYLPRPSPQQLTALHPHPVVNCKMIEYKGADPDYGDCPNTNGVFIDEKGRRFSSPPLGIWKIRLDYNELVNVSRPIFTSGRNSYQVETCSGELATITLEHDRVLVDDCRGFYQWKPNCEGMVLYVKTCSDWADQVEKQEKEKPPKPQRPPRRDPRKGLQPQVPRETEITEKKKQPSVTLVSGGQKAQVIYKGRTKNKKTPDGVYKYPGAKEGDVVKVKKMLKNWHIALVMCLIFFANPSLAKVQWFLKDENSTGINRVLWQRQVNRSLHGEWPNQICRGMPNETITDEELRSLGMIDTSPRTNYTCCQLQYHEWKKHGWCNYPQKQVWIKRIAALQSNLTGAYEGPECAVICRFNGSYNIVRQARDEVSPLTGCKEGYPFLFSGERSDTSCLKPPSTSWVRPVKMDEASVADSFAHGVDKAIILIRKGASGIINFLDTIGRWLPVAEAAIVPYCETYTVTGMYVHVKHCLPKGLPKHSKIISPTMIYLGEGDPAHNIQHLFGSGIAKWVLVLLGVLGEWYGELASTIYLLLEYGTEWLEHESLVTEGLIPGINITVELPASHTVPGWVWVAGQWVCVKPDWWPTQIWIETIVTEVWHILKILASALVNIVTAFVNLELVYLVIILVKISKGNLIGAVLWCLLLSGAEGSCHRRQDYYNIQLVVEEKTGIEKRSIIGKWTVITREGREPRLMEQINMVSNETLSETYCYNRLNTSSWGRQPIRQRGCGQTVPYWPGDNVLEEQYYSTGYWVNATGGCQLREGVWLSRKGNVQCQRNGTSLMLQLAIKKENDTMEIPCDPVETESMGPVAQGTCVYSWAVAPRGWYYNRKDGYWLQYIKKNDYQYWTKMPTTSSAATMYRHLLPLLVACLMGGRISVWIVAMLLSLQVEASEVGTKQLAVTLTLWKMDWTELLFYVVLMLVVKEDLIKKMVTASLVALKNSPVALSFLIVLRLVGGSEALPVGLLLEKMCIDQPEFGTPFLIYLWDNWKWTVLVSFSALNHEKTIKLARKLLLATHITALTLTGLSDSIFYVVLIMTNLLIKTFIYLLGASISWVEKEKKKLLVKRRLIYKHAAICHQDENELASKFNRITVNADFTPCRLELLQLLRAFLVSLCFSYYKPLLYAETTLTVIVIGVQEYNVAMARGRSMIHRLLATAYYIYGRIQGDMFQLATAQCLLSSPRKIMKHMIENPILKKLWQGETELFNQGVSQSRIVNPKKIGLEELHKGMCGLPTVVQNLVIYAKKNDSLILGEVGYPPGDLTSDGWEILGPGRIPKITNVESAKMDLLSKLMTFLGIETSRVPRTPVHSTRKLLKIVRGMETGWGYTHAGGVSSAKHVTGEKNLMTHMEGRKGKYILQSQEHGADEVEYGVKTDQKAPDNALCYCFNPEATNIKGETGAMVFMKRIGKKWTLVTSDGNKAYYNVNNLKGWSGLPIMLHSTGAIVGRIKSAYSDENDLVEELIDSRTINKSKETNLDHLIKELADMRRGEFRSITLGTGAGKTTELPRQYLTTVGAHKSVLVLVPLKAPAESVCRFMRSKYPTINFSLRVGERKEGDVSSGITYATYGFCCQLNLIQLKEWVSRYSMVFFDEYHTATPEQIAIISKIHALKVKTRIVAMSATPPGTVTTEGRRFDIEEVGVATIEKGEEPKRGRIAVAGMQVPLEDLTGKNCLVFVATKESAEMEAKELRAKGINATYYYSGIDPKTLEHGMTNQPYCIVATNAIESGITCPDLDVVIDTMQKYEKVVNFSAKMPLIVTSLVRKKITREEQGQRKGRVGRQKKGKYYYPSGVVPNGSKDLSYLILQAQEYGVLEQVNITEYFITMNEDWGLYDVDEVEVRILERMNKEILLPLGIVEKQILERSTHPEKVALLYNKLVQKSPIVYPRVQDGEVSKEYNTHNLAVYDKLKDVNPQAIYVLAEEERATEMMGLEFEQDPSDLQDSVVQLCEDIKRYTKLSGITEKLLVGTMVGYIGYKALTRNHVPWVSKEYSYELTDSPDTYENSFAPLDVDVQNPGENKRPEQLADHQLRQFLEIGKDKTIGFLKGIHEFTSGAMNSPKALSIWEKIYQYLKKHQGEIVSSAAWGSATALHDSIKSRLGDEVATAVIILKYLAFGDRELSGLTRQVLIDIIVYYIVNKPRFEGDDYAKRKGRRLVIEVLMGALATYAVSNFWGVSINKVLQPISDYLPYATATLAFLRPTFMESAVVVASSIYRAFLSIKHAENRSLVTQVASAALEVMGLTPVSAGLGVLLGLGLCVLHMNIDKNEEKRTLILKMFVKNFIDQAALDELDKLEPEKIILSLLEGIQTCTNPVRAIMILYRVYYKGESFTEALSKMAGKSLIVMVIVEFLELTGQTQGGYIDLSTNLLTHLLEKLKKMANLAIGEARKVLLPIPYLYCETWQSDPRIRAPESYDQVVVECKCGALARYSFHQGVHEMLEERGTKWCKNFFLWGPNFNNPDPKRMTFYEYGQAKKCPVTIIGEDITFGKYGIYVQFGHRPDGKRLIRGTTHATISMEELLEILTAPSQVAIGKVKLTDYCNQKGIIDRKLAVIEGDKIHFWKSHRGSKITDQLTIESLTDDLGSEIRDITWDLYAGGTCTVKGVSLRSCAREQRSKATVLCDCTDVLSPCYLINGRKPSPFDVAEGYECHHRKPRATYEDLEMEEILKRRVPVYDPSCLFDTDSKLLPPDTYYLEEDQEDFEYALRCWGLGVYVVDGPVTSPPSIRIHHSSTLLLLTPGVDSELHLQYISCYSHQAEVDIFVREQFLERENSTADVDDSLGSSDEGTEDVAAEEEDTLSIAESMPPLEEEEDNGENITYVVIRGLQEERHTSHLKLNDWISENITEPHKVQIMLDGTVRVTIKEGKVKHLFGIYRIENTLEAMFKETIADLPVATQPPRGPIYTAKELAQGNVAPVQPATNYYGMIEGRGDSMTAFEALSVLRSQKVLTKEVRVNTHKAQAFLNKVKKTTEVRAPELTLKRLLVLGKVNGRRLIREETNIPNQRLASIMTSIGIRLEKLPVVRANTSGPKFRQSILEKMDKHENEQVPGLHEKMWAAFLATARQDLKNTYEEVTYPELENGINRKGAPGFFEKESSIGEVLEKKEKIDVAIREIENGSHLYYETAMPKNEKRDVLDDWLSEDFVTYKKPRVIQYPEAVTRLAITKIMYKWVKQKPVVIPGYEGKTPIFEIFEKVSADWAQFRNPVAVSFDTKAWDTQVTREDLRLVGRIQKYYYKKRYWKFIDNLTAMMEEVPVVTVEGDMFLRVGQRGSGQPDTSAGNSILNVLTMLVAFSESTNLPIAAAWKACRIHVCGDDGFLITELELGKKFAEKGVPLLAAFGKPQKITEGASLKITSNFDGIEFCSHSPIRVQTPNVQWMPARPTATILGKMSTRLGEGATRSGEEYEKQVAFAYLLMYPWNPLVRRISLLLLSTTDPTGKEETPCSDEGVKYVGDPIAAYRDVWGHKLEDVGHVDQPQLSRMNYSMTYLGVWKPKTSQRLVEQCCRLAEKSNCVVRADSLIKKKVKVTYDPGIGVAQIIRRWEELEWTRRRPTPTNADTEDDLFLALWKRLARYIFQKMKFMQKMLTPY